MPGVTICCTGTARASHGKLDIVTLAEIRGQWWCQSRNPGDRSYTLLEELVEADGRYPLMCRRCDKRNTRVTPDTLTKALDAIAGAGLDYLDLRHLPF